MAQFGSAKFSLAQCGSAQVSSAHFSLAQFGSAWFGLIQFGSAQFGSAQFGVACFSSARFSTPFALQYILSRDSENTRAISEQTHSHTDAKKGNGNPPHPHGPQSQSRPMPPTPDFPHTPSEKSVDGPEGRNRLSCPSSPARVPAEWRCGPAGFHCHSGLNQPIKAAD